MELRLLYSRAHSFGIEPNPLLVYNISITCGSIIVRNLGTGGAKFAKYLSAREQTLWSILFRAYSKFLEIDISDPGEG